MEDTSYDLLVPAPGAAGPVPISHWRHVARLDQAGEIRAEMPGNHERTSLADIRRDAELISGMRSYGAGTINEVVLRAQVSGVVEKSVRGPDRLAELSKRIVKQHLSGPGKTPIAITAALHIIMSYAPPGWSIDYTTYTSTASTIYLEISGESVLAVLSKVAEILGEHFRLDGTQRRVVWLYKDQPHSRLCAQRMGAGGGDFCLIVGDVTRTISTEQVITRIYPFGSGTGDRRKTLAGATWTPPAGFSIGSEVADGKTRYYIRYDAGEPDAASIIEREESYDDISTPDELAKACYEDLRRQVEPTRTYSFSVTNVERPLLPGMKIGIMDRIDTNGFRAFDADEDLFILEVDSEIDTDGMQVMGLVTSTIDRWPLTDDELLTKKITQVTSMKAHVQPVDIATAADTATYAASAGTTADTGVARLTAANIFTAGNALSRGVTTLLGSATLTGSASVVFINPTTGVSTITLPSATDTTTQRRELKVKRIGSSTNGVTVVPPAGQNIDGSSAGKSLVQWEELTFQSNGTNWFITGIRPKETPATPENGGEWPQRGSV